MSYAYLAKGGNTATGISPNGTRARAATDAAEVGTGGPPPNGVPGCGTP